MLRHRDAPQRQAKLLPTSLSLATMGDNGNRLKITVIANQDHGGPTAGCVHFRRLAFDVGFPTFLLPIKITEAAAADLSAPLSLSLAPTRPHLRTSLRALSGVLCVARMLFGLSLLRCVMGAQVFGNL